MKKTAILLGTALLILGGLIAFGAFSVPDTRELLRVGDAAISVQTEKTLSPVLGYVLLGVGGVLTAAGIAVRRF
jgi:hypothetical protein